MKIYIVMTGNYSDMRVVGASTDFAKAELISYVTMKEEGFSYVHVVEDGKSYVTDFVDTDLRGYFVKFDEMGEVIEINEYAERYKGEEYMNYYSYSASEGAIYDKHEPYDEEHGWYYALASDVISAKKIAREKRAVDISLREGI